MRSNFPNIPARKILITGSLLQLNSKSVEMKEALNKTTIVEIWKINELETETLLIEAACFLRTTQQASRTAIHSNNFVSFHCK